MPSDLTASVGVAVVVDVDVVTAVLVAVVAVVVEVVGVGGRQAALAQALQLWSVVMHVCPCGHVGGHTGSICGQMTQGCI
jgi:hypothetical protein